MKIIYLFCSLFILNSCYASGNLGVVQKINDADLILETVGKIVDTK